MQIIPLTAQPAQTLSVVLSEQNCTIEIYQRNNGLFLDLYVNSNPVVTSVICRDRVYLIRYSYLGFIGDLFFIDTYDTNDPYYLGLGDRYQLAYIA